MIVSPIVSSHLPCARLHVNARTHTLRQTLRRAQNVTRPWVAAGLERKSAHSINGRIGAEISWSRTQDRSARTRPAREKFLQRFEREVDPDGKLPADERRRLAEHAKRAYMLRLASRAAAARRRAD